MSDFVKTQLSKIGIRMNGGLPRFQSQTLKKLRIPDIDSFDNNEKELLIEAYDKKDMRSINEKMDEYCERYFVMGDEGKSIIYTSFSRI